MHPAARAVGGVALAGSLLLACATQPAGDPFGPGLWPFFTTDATEWAGRRETRALGPFLHWEALPGERRFEARPLLARRVSEGGSEWDLLFPLAGRRETAELTESWLLLIARARRELEGKESEAQLGIAFRGRTEDDRGYGGIFPFAGVFLDFFGFDRIRFLLWPLLARGEHGAYTETQLLWPFFAYGSGGGRKKVRFWPFFGLDRKDGVYERRFYLWPFVHHRRERLDGSVPMHTLYIIPFYGRSEAGSTSSRFYLFPLYARRSDRAHPGVAQTDLLWPFFSHSLGADGKESLSLRPFYSRSRSAGVASDSFLLGIVGRSEVRSPELREVSWRFLWAGGIRERAEAGRRTRRVDLWPIYRSARVIEADGVERGFARVPALLPFRGLEPDGWDRSYQKLFELWGKSWRGAEVRSSLLFGLRETRRSPDAYWESWGGWLHLRRE